MKGAFKKSILIGGAILLAAGVWWVLGYGALLERGLEPGDVQNQNTTGQAGEESRGSHEPGQQSVEVTLEAVVGGLEVPWSLVFTDEDRMLVTARPGSIYQVVNERLDPEPLAVFEETVSEGEEGLMGLALDPEYENNRFLYVSLAYQKNGRKVLKVERLRDEGDRIGGRTILIDDIPAATYHAGSRLQFGPDGKLYVTTGDASQRELAQNRGSLAGKILRLNADGSTPSDNPFPGSPIWSLGHRNPQGLAWHPVSGALYATEHGPSGFDGPAGGDEVNHIVAGGNYGWPLVSHEESRSDLVDPLLVFTPAEAPASAAFYASDTNPQFTNQLFLGALRGQGVIRVKFDENDPNRVLEYEKLSEVSVGRIREIVEGPDGALYFTTSNRDGRGTARSGDDRIYRLRAAD